MSSRRPRRHCHRHAISLPLPTSLGGTTVIVRDSRGVERLALLFHFSPAQNRTRRGNGHRDERRLGGLGRLDGHPEPVAPGFLSADASGRGWAGATVGGVEAAVASSGPQPQFTSLDQVNILVPKALKGAGDVEVTLTVAGIATNIVKIKIR